MGQNFDEVISREGTHTFKYDLRKKLFGTEDIYPMWVADTEFKAPDFILNSLRNRLEHGIFGYTMLDDEYYQSIIDWNSKRHGWDIKKEGIKYSPGVVPSLFASVASYTEPGDKVIVQTPVYHPFFYAIKEQGREIVQNPLVLKEGRYEMDLDDLKSKIDEKTKMLFLCSPHNPTGNVWKKEELLKLCEICLENSILIISDEIHADIIYPGNKHIPTASLSDKIAKNTVTLMAPSKTFNIAGLNSSYIVAQNKELLTKIVQHFEGMHIGPNIFAIEATKAAYKNGQDWLSDLIRYFEKNISTVRQYVDSQLSDIEMINPEGTFLVWMDFRKKGFSRKELLRKIHQEAKVGLSDGFIFGKEGEGFQRMNIGCANGEIVKAMESLVSVFK
jgi:cystathionine beta-lyase